MEALAASLVPVRWLCPFDPDRHPFALEQASTDVLPSASGGGGGQNFPAWGLCTGLGHPFALRANPNTKVEGIPYGDEVS
jgi:hypothetical protein